MTHVTEKTASLKAGLIAGPDAGLFPRLARHWEQIQSKNLRIVQPEYRPVAGASPADGLYPPGFKPFTNYYFSQVPFWSGSIVESTAQDAMMSIGGKFNVTAVETGTFLGKSYVETWLGFGGYMSEYSCGIGVHQEVDVNPDYSETRKYYLFSQWGTVRNTITTFSIAVMDEIDIQIAVSPSPAVLGYFIVSNGKMATGGSFQPLSAAPIQNESAEWIVSRPPYYGVEPTSPTAARYGRITFQNAFAETFSGRQLGIGSGILRSYNVFGHAASTPARQTSNETLELDSW